MNFFVEISHFAYKICAHWACLFVLLKQDPFQGRGILPEETRARGKNAKNDNKPDDETNCRWGFRNKKLFCFSFSHT